MTLRALLAGCACVTVLALAAPAMAQSDAGGQAIIGKLKPV